MTDPSMRNPDAPPTPSLPADVLGRLKNVVQAFAGHVGTPRAVVDIQMLRDAVAEIERLRETVRVVASSEQAPDEAPKPERWEMKYTVCPADQLDYTFHKDDDWEPFALISMSHGDRAQVWFRRRVPA